LDTPQKIDDALIDDDAVRRSRTLTERLARHLEAHADEVVVVDPDSSDRLLMLLLEKHGKEVLDGHPAGRGLGRPPRIASVARRFLEMIEDDGSASDWRTPG
jgi:hypothetical protein